MLTQINLEKDLSHINLFFLSLHSTNFLIIQIKETKQKFYVKIWFGLEIKKLKNFLIICPKFGNQKENCLKFFHFFLRILKSLKVVSRKILVLNGLGLKFLLESNNIRLKLGYSHDILVPINLNTINIRVKKYGLKGFFITFFSLNKIILGNLTEKIYKLKKADCYKARGFYYKDREILLKTIKKT